MAVPSYTTDLTTYNDCTDATGWLELIGMALSAPPDIDTDLAIHGSICITSDRAKTGLSSNAFVGAGFTLATGECIFVWHKFFAPNSLGTLANGGVRVMVGDSSSVWDGFYVDGSDTYPYGGWRNHVVDPTLTPDSSAGTTTGTYAMVGNGWNLPTQAPAKGNPFNTDIIRYGRGESRFTGGEAADYATFLGYSLINDNPTTGRFGLIQAVGGGYLYKGLMSLGLTATLVDMRDANVNITIDNTFKVLSSFNRIEVHNASSNIEWDRVNITALGTVSKGEFEMVDNATVAFTDCVFTDMSTFIFQSNATLLREVFNRCGLITQGGSTITQSVISNGTATTSILSDDIDLITGCTFESDGSNHAIELTSAHAAGTFSCTDNTFTGYETYNASGTATGNEAIYNNSGGAVVINVSGGALPSFRNGTSATTTVQASYTLTLTDIPTGVQVTIVNSSTRTELQNSTSTGVDITYAHQGGETVDILLMDLDYDPNLSDIFDLTLPSSNSSIKFQMIDDPNFNNPA